MLARITFPYYHHVLGQKYIHTHILKRYRFHLSTTGYTGYSQLWPYQHISFSRIIFQAIWARNGASYSAAGISRADLWSLAAIEAVKYTVNQANAEEGKRTGCTSWDCKSPAIDIPFKPGR